MRQRSIAFVMLVLCFTSISHASDQDVSIGVGVGALYGGIGINAGLRGDNDFRYIAAGCIALSYWSGGGWQAACGVGVGWMWTNILSSSSNKHGLGFYLGPVDHKGSSDNMEGTVYGAGVSYGYFFRGINESGWNLGATPAIGHDDEADAHLILQAGYQF